MTSFTLKLIGIISMLLDHIGHGLIRKFSFLNLIGRFAFPIFAYQAVQSYIHTKNIKKYLTRLLIFAILSQIPFMMFSKIVTDKFSLDVLFTLFIGVFAILLYEKISNKYLKIIVIILLSVINELIKADYGAFGVILIFIFYYFEVVYKGKNRNLLYIICLFLTCNIKYLFKIIEYPNYTMEYFLSGIFTFLTIFIIFMHNKKEGLKIKYFFYLFYPLHFIVLTYIYNTIK